MLRRIKLFYSFYNLFHRRSLIRHKRLYKLIGLSKYYFSPVSSKDFKDRDPDLLKRTRSYKSLQETEAYKKLPLVDRQSLSAFEENGFAVLKGYFSGEKIDRINAEVEGLLQQGKLKFERGRIMFAIKSSPFLKSVGEDVALTELLSALMQEEMKLFQSINFKYGSEQHTHSDSIHMTTFPAGGLLGVWIALEDITEDNGPLHYYPGSHKLPYYLNADYENEGNFLLLGKKGYASYEKMIEEKLSASKLGKETFLARKGDLLIWHANLFHGGESHRNKNLTRKSMVFHYFGRDRICYHEITQRPALME